MMRTILNALFAVSITSGVVVAASAETARAKIPRDAAASTMATPRPRIPGFSVSIPEPDTAAIVAFSALALLRRRRGGRGTLPVAQAE